MNPPFTACRWMAGVGRELSSAVAGAAYVCDRPGLPEKGQMVSDPPRSLQRIHVRLSGPVQDAFSGIQPGTLPGLPHTVGKVLPGEKRRAQPYLLAHACHGTVKPAARSLTAGSPWQSFWKAYRYAAFDLRSPSAVLPVPENLDLRPKVARPSCPTTDLTVHGTAS